MGLTSETLWRGIIDSVRRDYGATALARRNTCPDVGKQLESGFSALSTALRQRLIRRWPKRRRDRRRDPALINQGEAGAEPVGGVGDLGCSS
jgi:hypothetical protein